MKNVMPSLKLKIKADSSNSLRLKIIINYPLLKIEGHPSEANSKADLRLTVQSAAVRLTITTNSGNNKKKS